MSVLSVSPETAATRSAELLFSPLRIRGVELKNRIGVSPMCQYSANDGFANDWHFVHLGSRAVGGAGLVIVEATAVEARGRITPGDLGLWKDEQIEPLARIVQYLEREGAVAGIQLAHAGRKASCDLPWNGGNPLTQDQGGWETVAPSAVPFRNTDPIPHALTRDEIRSIRDSFAASAKRALAAGFKVIEIHGAHGYLLNEFLSPLSNRRTDEYGGSFDNRIRIVREIAQAIREVWPAEYPLFVRFSVSDWKEGGWTADDSVELARRLQADGVDLIDCSSGGLVPDAVIPVGPGYQVPFAAKLKHEAGIATAAVGMITQPQQAATIIGEGQADLVLLARELLRDPYWPHHAAKALGVRLVVPPQYLRSL